MAERFEHTLGDADALMWHIDRDPQLRSTIVAVLMLERAPAWSDLVERLERGVRLIPRLRQRVVEPALPLVPPSWSADPNFDLAYHLRRLRAPKPRSVDFVLDFAATAAMGDFDRARPLWELTLIEALPESRAAVVLKVHHSMTDGVGGMKLLLMLFDLDSDPSLGTPEPPPLDLPTYTRPQLLVRKIEWQARQAATGAQGLWRSARDAYRTLRDDAGRTIGQAARTAGSVARYMQPAPRALSPVLGAHSLDRRVSTVCVSLDGLRRAGKAADASLNDAFVAGVLGGLHRYHLEHGDTVEELRMMMPINLRGEGAPLGGNHFTTARLLVPLLIEDPAERIREISERCRRLRAEPAVALSEQLASAVNRLPRRIATALFGSLLKGIDFITSNVPGTPFPLYFCGAPVEEIYAFGPLSGSAANIVLMSYCDRACLGINTDLRAIPDTARFTEHIRHGLDEVITLA